MTWQLWPVAVVWHVSFVYCKSRVVLIATILFTSLRIYYDLNERVHYFISCRKLSRTTKNVFRNFFVLPLFIHAIDKNQPTIIPIWYYSSLLLILALCFNVFGIEVFEMLYHVITVAIYNGLLVVESALMVAVRMRKWESMSAFWRRPLHLVLRETICSVIHYSQSENRPMSARVRPKMLEER